MAVVRKLCLGQSRCVLQASDSVFGIACSDVSIKRLLVHATCSSTPPPSFVLSVAIPVNSVSRIFGKNS